MNEIYFKTEKTARVYTLGKINQNTTELVIVCHGYAMLAKYFIKNFESIASTKRIIIAPEGLSKFYWNGMNGKVRASWMTSEDREHEIEDYINYIDTVVNSFLIKTTNKIKVTILGFSQGAATATRWATKTNINVDRLILWAGGFPKDCTQQFTTKYPTKTIEIIIGNEDEYISEQNITKETTYLKENKLNYSLTLFKGKHHIEENTLQIIF